MERAMLDAADFSGGAMFKSTKMRRVAAHLISLLVASSLSAPTIAITWDGNASSPPSGTYSIANNWNPNQVPSSGGTATFNVDDTYTVTFGANASPIGQLDVTAGYVTFASTGSTKALPVTSGGTQNVTITGGATLELGSVDNHRVNLTVGGQLTVQQGATLYNNSQITANGNVTIDGGQISSLPPINGTLTVASGRTMTVINGGSFDSVGNYITSTNATYNVSGQSSSITASTFSIKNGAAVNLASGGLLLAGAELNIANATNGTLTADGESTYVTALTDAESDWGVFGGTALVTFTNDANGVFMGGLNLANTATPGTTALVNVLSGADITSGRLHLANLGGTTTSATVNVQGDGSTFTLTDSMNNLSFIGHTSQGTAQINVGTTESGATFIADAEVFSIEPTGILSVGSPTTTGSFFAPGGISVRGDVNLAGGDMTVDQTLSIDPGGDFNFTGGTLRAVNIAGSLQNDGGILAPGFILPAISTLSISGNYIQSEEGTLQIEIGSTPTSFDKLQTAGAATLDGILEIILRDRVPVLSETFEIVTAGAGLGGEFQTLVLPDLGGDLAWEIIYDADSVTLGVIDEAAALPGDYNHDDEVNAADYVVWRKIGTPYSYAIWRAHFGETASSGADASGNATPEPVMSLLLATVAAVGVLKRRRTYRGRVSKLFYA
jgi:hypothetical protein